jgi:glutathione S-transferase
MKALPGWAHPYDIMPGYPFGTSGYRNRKVS